MNANNTTATNTAAAIDNLAAEAAANATAALQQPTTVKPSKTGLVRWTKRAGALVALVGVGYVAHKFGALEFVKAKFCGTSDTATDIAV